MAVEAIKVNTAGAIKVDANGAIMLGNPGSGDSCCCGTGCSACPSHAHNLLVTISGITDCGPTGTGCTYTWTGSGSQNTTFCLTPETDDNTFCAWSLSQSAGTIDYTDGSGSCSSAVHLVVRVVIDKVHGITAFVTLKDDGTGLTSAILFDNGSAIGSFVDCATTIALTNTLTPTCTGHSCPGCPDAPISMGNIGSGGTITFNPSTTC